MTSFTRGEASISLLLAPQFSRTLVKVIVITVMLLGAVAVYAIRQGDMPHLVGAILGGSAAAVATGLGTLPVLLSWQPTKRVHDAMLGFGAGVMLAACAFSLIVPGLDAAAAMGWSRGVSSAMIGTGILAGAFVLLLIDHMLPHEHFIKGVEGSRLRQLKRVWLFVIAIALHNLPEGLAIGVAFAGPDISSGWALATGIAIQDIPEGLVVALALR